MSEPKGSTEARLLKAVSKGETADLAGEPLDATLLRDLCVGRHPSCAQLPGPVHVKGVEIHGELSFRHSELKCALIIENCNFRTDVDLRDAFIPSLVFIASACPGVNAQQLRTVGNFELIGEFNDHKLTYPAVCETINLQDAVIGGSIFLSGCRLTGRGGVALAGDRLRCAGSLMLRQQFETSAQVALAGAQIEGDLDFRWAKVTAAPGVASSNAYVEDPTCAVFADKIRVGGGVLLQRLSSTGSIRLRGATVTGDLSLVDSSLARIEPDKNSFSADGMEVGGSVHLRRGFTHHGRVGFVGVKVNQVFFINELNIPPPGPIDLRYAAVGTFADDATAWTDSCNLLLNGFGYERLGPQSPVDFASRKEWLRRMEFVPQIYEQLSRVLIRMDLRDEARKIAMEKQWRALRDGKLTLLQKAFNFLLWATLGYGYRPWRLLGWSVAFWALGLVIFEWAHRSFAMLFQQTLNHEAAQLSLPQFFAPVYSLDVLLPIVDLHQSAYWIPNSRSLPGLVALAYFWLETLAGWLLSTLLVVAVTGLVREE